MGLFGKSKPKEDTSETLSPMTTVNTGGASSESSVSAFSGVSEPKTKSVRAAKPQKQKDETPEQKLARGIPSVRDVIAPSAIEVDYNFLKVGDKYFRTLFISGYPRFVGANWLEPIINFDHTLTISMFYYPINARNVLDDLRRKIAEMEATINIAREKGKVIDPGVQAALEDAKSLQEQLVKGIERFFHFSFYVTVSANTLDELNNITYQVESTLGSLSLISKKATLEMEAAFQTTVPVCLDKLKIIRNMDTTSVATTFPFTSSELTSNEGILYGVNKHNGSLIIFDRFSLENANSVIFAKSGAGKSYLVKLEALRSLLFGVDLIVIDPETEYRKLSDAVGGEYIDFSINSSAKINPFDLPVVPEVEDQLSMKILSLHALFRIMLGELSSSESAVLDRALIDTYRLKGITQDPNTQQDREPPLMEDLYKVLLAMDEPESKSLAERMERYIKGSLAGVFDQRSNVSLENSFTVFSIRNLQDVLRPIAMFMILDFIWTKVKHDLKKRILLLDEAWTLMQYPDSAAFVYSLAKRARKYYLGLTTITQDVNDFLNTDYGKAVVTNSSIQILLKQHPAAIDKISEIFYLSQGERNFLLAAGIGEGLFFAGTNHVAMQVKASPLEHQLVTTNPKEVKAEQDEQKQNNAPVTPSIPQRNEQDFERLKQRFETVDINQPRTQPAPQGMPQAQPIQQPGQTQTQQMPNPYQQTNQGYTQAPQVQMPQTNAPAPSAPQQGGQMPNPFERQSFNGYQMPANNNTNGAQQNNWAPQNQQQPNAQPQNGQPSQSPNQGTIPINMNGATPTPTPPGF